MMTSSTSSNHSISEVRADVKLWPQLPPFKQKMSANHPSVVGAGFVSMVIHAFLAYLLCVVVTDRTTVVGPAAPSIDAPLVVSLVSLPAPATAPHGGVADGETVSAVPDADPADQYAQSPPERSRSTERTSEGEPVIVSKDQRVPGAEASVGKSPSTDATKPTKLKAADHIAREVVKIPEFEAGLVLPSRGQGGMGPEAPEGTSFATGSIPSIGLGAVNAWGTGSMPMTELELQDLRSKLVVRYEMKHSSPDCPGIFVGGGLLAAPFFLKDVITGNGYKWFIQEQEDQEREKDQERMSFMSDLMDVTDTFKQ